MQTLVLTHIITAMRIWLIFFGTSLLIHLTVWTTFVRPYDPLALLERQPIEVSIVEEQTLAPKTKFNRTVKDLLPPLEMLKPLDSSVATYQGHRDQRVKKETVAPNYGQDRNKISKAQIGGTNIVEESKEGLSAQKNRQSSKLGKLGQTLFSDGPSYTQYLPDTETGPVTALNTERFVYSSFFNRIEERFMPTWQRNFQNTIARKSDAEQRQLINQQRWVTQVEVILDSKGYVEDVIILNSSGSAELDNDAAQAFLENKYYPNPPQKMLKEDGKIHLMYKVALHTDR